MVCMFVERVKEYCFTFFFSVNGLECFILNFVSLSVERCCFLLVVDCISIYNTLKNVSLYFCTNCPSVLLILYSTMTSFWGIALCKSYYYYYIFTLSEIKVPSGENTEL